MVGALKLSVWSLNHYKILVCISRLFLIFIFLAIALLIVISIRIKFLQRHQHPIHHPKVLTINWWYIREFNPLSTSSPLPSTFKPYRSHPPWLDIGTYFHDLFTKKTYKIRPIYALRTCYIPSQLHNQGNIAYAAIRYLMNRFSLLEQHNNWLCGWKIDFFLL